MNSNTAYDYEDGYNSIGKRVVYNKQLLSKFRMDPGFTPLACYEMPTGYVDRETKEWLTRNINHCIRYDESDYMGVAYVFFECEEDITLFKIRFP